MTLGQMIARRMNNSDTSQFRAALEAAKLTGNYDPMRGYTVFAVANNSYNKARTPEYFIVNDRVALGLIHGNHETVQTISGETLSITRSGNEYYINDMLVNDVQRNPEGLIYTVGGNRTSASLHAPQIKG